MVFVNRERQCLGGSALSMTMIPSDNKAEHINITIAKTHNITNWPIQWVIGQFDEIGQLGCSLHTDWPIWRIGQFDVTDHCLVPPIERTIQRRKSVFILHVDVCLGLQQQ